eukprot:SM000011S19073  [mRNA]  locus=s11:774681:776519:- [translate_table: standard]
MVHSVRVVWSEPQPPPSDLRASMAQDVKEASKRHPQPTVLQFDVHKQDSLNNRFKPLEGPQTGAIFSVDDDVIIPCSTMDVAFATWVAAPDTMVGFVPRMHWITGKMNSEHGLAYKYGGWWSVWWTGTYSIVLSKAAFVHHKYFELYTNLPSNLLEFVHKGRNCEDIALSFLVANITRVPPIWISSHVAELSHSGAISSAKAHSRKRTKCINRFVEVFGQMPLVQSHVKVMDARASLIW